MIYITRLINQIDPLDVRVEETTLGVGDTVEVVRGIISNDLWGGSGKDIYFPQGTRGKIVRFNGGMPEVRFNFDGKHEEWNCQPEWLAWVMEDNGGSEN